MINRHSYESVFRDHPILPVGQDPLATANSAARAEATPPTGQWPRLGFACHWEANPEQTWSGSASNLRAALGQITETADIGVRVPRLSRVALKALHTRYYGGRLTTTWACSGLTDRYMRRCLHRELSRRRALGECDAAIVIEDLAALPVPFFTYYDSSWDLLIAATQSAHVFASLRAISPSTLARRRARQIAVYEQANGVIAFSRWHARNLIEQSGISPEKVHVALPGIKGYLDDTGDPGRNERRLIRPVPHREGPRRRLLFVGRQHQWYDFYRKGGDLAVAALAILRRDYDPRVTLTIVGVDRWPMPGSPPDGVSLLGALPAHEVRALYDSHDLFVMPSRFEPFGLVFAEAIASGLPCVARNACAMPEIVTPGLSGALVTSDDEYELAATIAASLTDDALYENCASRAPAFAAYFSWERAARDMVQVIYGTLNGLTPTEVANGKR